MLIFSIISDIDWLSSSYRPAPVSNHEFASVVGAIQLLPIGHVVWFVMLLNLFIKTYLIFSSTSLTESGRKLQLDLWKRAQFFGPPCTFNAPADLHNVIQTRIIAIQWIQLICSIGMLIVAMVVYIQMSWSPHFNLRSPFVPFKLLLIFKGITGMGIFFGIMRNTNVETFSSEFGCRLCKTKNTQSKKKNGLRVKVDGEFICFTLCIKSVDFLVGLLIWVGLIWIYNLGTSSQSKPVRTLLQFVVILQLVTDVWVVVLGFFVHW